MEFLTAFMGGSKAAAPIGEQIFTGTTNTTFTVPEGVESLCVVCVGRGIYWAGTLAWKNNIPATYGQVFTISMSGGQPAISFMGTTYCAANYNSVVGDGGGLGSHAYGGGAGGYNGAGGASNNAAPPGGGGGGGSSHVAGSIYFYEGGGGVGLYGQGASGVAPVAGGPGKGGSGGADGTVHPSNFTAGNGGLYGGAAGYINDYSTNPDGDFREGVGGGAAMRIMWGDNRSFPFAAEYVTPVP